MLINTAQLKEITNNATLSTAKEKDSILYNTLIKIENKKLTAISMNNITTLTQTAETDTEENISFVIDTQKLSGILKEINTENIELNINERTLTIKAENFKTTIKIQDGQMFPQLPKKEYKPITKIEAEVLKKLIKETIYCPDKNDISREYTGIYIEFEQEKIKATATDHYRLINISASKSSNTEESLIIENAGATLINRIPLNGEIEILKSEDEIMIKSENLNITSKLINSAFPDYNQILLNKETSNTVELNRSEFKDAIRRSSILSSNREITIEVNLNEKKATIKAQNQEGETAEDIIEINPKQAESNLIIKLDSKFILDFLNQTNSETVDMIYKTGEDPIMFKAEEDIYSYKYIMTPIIE
ncbi:DNA polymerase III subunit beta [Hippea alviniae]|uniref:DNA polymerase III subunit beta n=1 Tax=Hippea alviniae TaxID=1279027 RepID=UPI0003B55EAB|nr:DNA polymerase III subunit beta [Hippea alviniae]